MDLWIKSQDRECLMKVDRIDYDNSTGKHYIVVNGFKTYLGKYKSKERTLEVLDEIHKILNPKGIIRYDGFIKQEDIKKIQENLNNEYLIFSKNVELLQQVDSYVYEMPKE